jgi:Leucine-rich repeat (LRR) protein
MLCRYQVVTLEGIQALFNLRRLALCSGIDSLGPVSQLYQLEELVIQDTQISDLSALTGLRNLKRLEIRGSQVSDLSPLANLTRLETLIVANSQVEDLKPLSNLTNLKRLFLYNNQIRDIRPLAGLDKLEMLNLSDNQISDVMPLANKQFLLNLYLARNQVSDIRPLTTLPSLIGLDLRCNPAGISGPLEMLENLQWIDVRCTNIVNPEVTEACISQCGRADQICLYVNGVCLEPDQPPIVEAGCTLLPLSAVAKAIGAGISWEAESRTAVMLYQDHILRIPVDQEYAMLNGRRIDVYYRTQIRNGRTMIHSRLLIDAFNLRIHFDAENRVVMIDSQ